ncbi:MAG: FHA domain-containing protein [Rhodobacteraceae bacterium]|nr:FHA domain-containing protein [Paracoccaceae bacterium]
MDVEDIESLFHDSVQDVAQPNADEAHNTTDNDLSLGAEPKMDDPREAPMRDPKGVPRYGIENVASPASGETPALPTPQPEQPRAPRAGMNNFVSGLTEMVNVPAPAVGRGAARTGRVKTRLLGFNHGKNAASDPFAKPTQQNSAGFTQYPVGWLIVVDGPGEGSAFTLFDGVSQIGRGSDQTVCLDFGDNSISRENHAVVAYDSENKKFFLGHGGKTNLVRLEDRPVLSTEEMVSGNTIRIGETTLRFVGLCGSDFQWQKTPREDRQNASFS